MSPHKDADIRELFEKWVKGASPATIDVEIETHAKRYGLKPEITRKAASGTVEIAFPGSQLVIRHDDANGWRLMNG